MLAMQEEKRKKAEAAGIASQWRGDAAGEGRKRTGRTARTVKSVTGGGGGNRRTGHGTRASGLRRNVQTASTQMA